MIIRLLLTNLMLNSRYKCKNNIDLPIDPFYMNEVNKTNVNDYNKQRRLKIMLMSEILDQFKEYHDLAYNDKIDILMRIENSCTNETIRKAREYNLRCVWDNPQFTKIYHTVCFNITSVLDDVSNTLLQKILNKDLDLNVIAKLPCKDLSPEKYDEIMYRINKRVNIEQTIKYTEMHFCKKCKRNQTTVERVQNRSGDEGSSFYITCLFCGTKWFK